MTILTGHDPHLFVKVLVGILFLSQTGFSRESTDDTESTEKNEYEAGSKRRGAFS